MHKNYYPLGILLLLSMAKIAIGMDLPAPVKWHPKIQKEILVGGHLIHPDAWQRASASLGLGEKSFFSDERNPRKNKISLIRDASGACFAVHPGENAILGEGKDGRVKLAELISRGRSLILRKFSSWNLGCYQDSM